MIELSLPFPPSVNTYYAVVRGRKILSAKGREYKAAVIGYVFNCGRINEKVGGRLQLHIKLTPPCRRRRDIDNYLKALLDAITNAGVWCDDSQIKRLSVELLEPQKVGRADVRIIQMTDGVSCE